MEYSKGKTDGAKEELENFRTSDEYQSILTMEYSKGKTDGAKEGLENFRTSEDYQAILEGKYLKGKIDGTKEELERFQISYCPIVIDNDKFFSHTFEGGYEMQLFYSGLPIGEPTRRITKHQEKSNDENINKFIEFMLTTLNAISSANSKYRIPTFVNQEVMKTKKEA
jgi:hypothetical protein